MKRWQGIAVIAVIAGMVVGEWHVASTRDSTERVTAVPPTPAAKAAAVAPEPGRRPEAPAMASGEGDGLHRVPIPPVDTSTPAWLPLAQARESGDARTPPIERSDPARHPDASVLADPEAYAAHELAQKQRLAAAYAQAAVPELARLQADLEQGREAGIPPEELAKVKEKIRRIEQQRQAAEALRSK